MPWRVEGNNVTIYTIGIEVFRWEGFGMPQSFIEVDRSLMYIVLKKYSSTAENYE